MYEENNVLTSLSLLIVANGGTSLSIGLASVGHIIIIECILEERYDGL